jgi:DNA-binding IclR family transcriptional regulator
MNDVVYLRNMTDAGACPLLRDVSSSQRMNVEMKRSKPLYGAPALEKGLDILELLSMEPTGLSKAEIARRLGRTPSEVFRMLVCLEDRGYISRPPGDDLICLTLKLFQMALEHPPAKRMTSEALPIMHEACRAMRQSCHLAVVDDGQVVILAQVDSPASQEFHVRAGSTVDLMEAASGYVILAFQDTQMREHTIERWRERTKRRVPPNLRQHLARIREAGSETRPSYIVEGVINISFPIYDSFSHAVAALTVPYIKRTDHTSSVEIVHAYLARASLQVTEAIGGRALKLDPGGQVTPALRGKAAEEGAQAAREEG